MDSMNLREFIELLLELADGNEEIEIVAIADDGEEYTPVVSIGPSKDGVRRISVA